MMLNKSLRTTCRLLPLLMVAVMLSASVNTLELAVPKSSERVGVTHEGAVANAREFFNTHFGSSTRSEEQQPTPEAPYVVGNLVPDWESGVTVANEEKCYTDFAMQKDYHYFLLLGEEESEQMQAVELYSRFVSVEDVVDGTMSQYVATYIPDEEYLNSYGAVAQDYGINCAEWYEFSGVVLYTLPHGHHVAAYRYKEGELVAGSFLYDSEQTTEQNIADFMAVTEGIRVSVGELSEGTRSDVLYGGTIEEIVIVYDTGFPIFIIDNTDIWETGNRLIEPFDNFHIVLGGGGGGTTKEEEPTGEKIAEELFDTSKLSKLSETDRQALNDMLEEIYADCMGKVLLTCLMSGDKITITFNFASAVPSNYNYREDSIAMTNYNGDTLLHELFHAYQYSQIETLNKNASKEDIKTIYCQSSANYEVEGQIARYVYLLRRRSQDTSGRYDAYCRTKLGKQIQGAGNNIDMLGNLYIDEQTYYDDYYKPSIDAVLHIAKNKNVANINYDESLSMDQNLSNLKSVSIKCN